MTGPAVYRVVWTRATSAAGLSGWAQEAVGFDTEAEAVAALARPFGAGVLRARVDVRTVTGWRRIAERARRGAA